MPVGGYKIRDIEGIYFITFAVVEWIDVFTRQQYRDIVLDSLRYCQKEKGLLIHGWCLMSNHIHLILSSKENNPSDILRDFKKFTSKQIIEAIQSNKKESRREWMLEIFAKQGKKNSRNSNFQFWRQENRPIEIFSTKFIVQKLNYIHNNPVEAGIVHHAVDYIYSSAVDYYGKGKGQIDIVAI